MQISGLIKTTCSPAALVRALRDPDCLLKLLPPDSTLEQTGDGTYVFSVTKGIGPIKLTLPGTLTLTPAANGIDQILSARAAHIIGGKVEFDVTLHIDQNANMTRMAYDGQLTATGLAGRVLNEHQLRANNLMRSSMLRIKAQAELLQAGV